MFLSFFTGKVMLFYGISLIMKEKSNASALILLTRLSSTGLWTCFHWPVYMFLLASGRISIGQWKHVHCQVNDASSPVERRVLACGTTRPHLGATRPRVGIANLGFETPSWQYILLIILYLLVKASSLDKQMPTRGRVAPR